MKEGNFLKLFAQIFYYPRIIIVSGRQNLLPAGIVSYVMRVKECISSHLPVWNGSDDYKNWQILAFVIDFR
ncbi:hypothetical protein SAMD00079811_12040 [Scytonema sp. HK-05]|nr:hypothetical protein NIES2130_04015 [Scytonema sp. HK-05]BAY43624.1 hypothetical protein SAMD00079811_12040 [Scytonema sp. HK-05]